MLRDIKVQHFRSYDNAIFSFSPGVNIIAGPNASGKTNLLEAILMTALGRSYRAKDQELIQFDQPWSRVTATIADGSTRTVKIVSEPAAAKSYILNEKPYLRMTQAHSLPVVLFEPNHLQLLSGSPERRRSYLDDILEQTQPGYATLVRQYRRTLSQRNALLKRLSPVHHTELFPWNLRLSQLGGQIVRARANLSEVISPQLHDVYRQLSKSTNEVELFYQPRWPVEAYETNLLTKLESSVELDRLRGFTAYGPHREDFIIYNDGRIASETASRGEVRTTVLALKIVELKMLKVARGQVPLLLLDDVFSELDESRREALTAALQSYQTFITTTDADVVSSYFNSSSRILNLQEKT